LSPQFWDTVYISEVNGASQVNKQELRPGADFFSLGVAGGQCPQLKFFQTSGIVRNEWN